MDHIDYTYEFSDISQERNRLTMTNHSTQSVNYPKVVIKDFWFNYRKRKRFSGLVADFVDLAVAVYVADRLSKHPDNQQCRIHVILPVRCPGILGDVRSLALLADILYWYTNNHWTFEFKQRSDEGRISELSYSFKSTDSVEVALCSGGLDSCAGFLTRQSAQPKQAFVLFGTGSNRSIIGYQRQLVKRIRATSVANVNFIQVPFYLDGIANLTTNRILRSRGFVFTLLGAVCSYLEGQNTLYIYENGIGAINLPYPGGVGLDHSRAVHPLSLNKMSELVSYLLNESFTFVNPFLFLVITHK